MMHLNCPEVIYDVLFHCHKVQDSERGRLPAGAVWSSSLRIIAIP